MTEKCQSLTSHVSLDNLIGLRAERRMARNLLCEFIGGEPGAQLRDQFT